MAFYTETLEPKPAKSETGGIFTRFINRVFAAQNRSVEVNRMQDLSDRQLADIGMRREDIVRHVYRDIYYV